MNNIRAVFTIMLLLCFSNADGMILNRLLSIGSNDINYLFFTISSAVLDDDGNIYVADSKGYFIRKYDKCGVFLKEIGKHGQGPGDFGDVITLNWNKALNVIDGKNFRIVLIDQDLNILKYIKIRYIAIELVKLNDLYYSWSSKQEPNSDQIKACDDQGNIKYSFFSEWPDYLNSKSKNRMEHVLKVPLSGIHIQGREDCKELVVTYRNPGTTLDMFYFSPAGMILRKHSIGHLIKYHPPTYLLKWPILFPEKSVQIFVESIHYLDINKVIIKYSVLNYNRKNVDEIHSYAMIIDAREGKILDKLEIDSNIEIMDVKANRLLAKNFGADMQEIYLYELKY